MKNRFVLAAGALLALATASAHAQQVSPITFEEVNDRFGVESTLTDLQKDRQWDAFEGKCVEWTGELSSLSEGFFGGSVSSSSTSQPRLYRTSWSPPRQARRVSFCNGVRASATPTGPR